MPVGAGWWKWGTLPRGRGRRLPDLKAADEVVPSQQLKNDGPQGVVICCPVQGKDIKAPKVHVLWRNKELSRETPKTDIPAAARAAVRLQGGLPNDYRHMGSRKIHKYVEIRQHSLKQSMGQKRNHKGNKKIFRGK